MVGSKSKTLIDEIKGAAIDKSRYLLMRYADYGMVFEKVRLPVEGPVWEEVNNLIYWQMSEAI